MFARKTLGTAALAGVGLLFGLTACGDQPTANRDYYVLATHSSHTEVPAQPVGYPATFVHDVLSGHLIDAKGRPIASSSFYEDCIFPLLTKRIPLDSSYCTVLVKTGPKTYASRGGGFHMSGGVGYYYGMLGSLGPGPAFGPGTSVTWILPNGSGTSPYKLKVSIRIWGSAPVDPPSVT
jgi:hypothetical protein